LNTFIDAHMARDPPGGVPIVAEHYLSVKPQIFEMLPVNISLDIRQGE